MQARSADGDSDACPDLASGALKFSVTTWTSLPSEGLVRVGAVDATSGVETETTAREMYVSLVVTRDEASDALRDDPEKKISLRGVAVAFEFSRRVVQTETAETTDASPFSTPRSAIADPSRFVFMCWGAQLMPVS